MIAGIRALSRPGQVSLFARLVDLFAASSSRQLEQLRAALSRGDLTAAAAACHALKGGAGNVGAAGVAAIAGRLRQACSVADRPAIDTLLRELEHLHPAALAALEAEALKESA
jgi:HPt (histidine-containing phosphotransfer) domain-containing protein